MGVVNGTYVPQPVEVLDTMTVVNPSEIAMTFRNMLSYILTTVLQMLSHRDKQAKMMLDPTYKHGFINIAVLLQEDVSDDELKVARQAVMDAFDKSVADVRRKMSPIVLDEPKAVPSGSIIV